MPRRKQALPWLPETLHAAITRRVRFLAGAALMLTGIACALALVSYVPSDSSLNSAQGGIAGGAMIIHNWLGAFGSYGADLLRQFFGLASYLLCVVLAAWGWRLMSGRSLDHLAGRMAMTLFALILCGTALQASIPAMGGHPAGGAFGLLLARKAASLLPAAWGGYAMTGAGLLLTAAAVYMACALTLAEWSALWAHIRSKTAWLLAAMAGLGRWFLRRFRDPQPEDEADEPMAQNDNAAPALASVKPAPVKRPQKSPMIKKTAASARQAKLALEGENENPLPPLDLLPLPDPAKANREIAPEALRRNAELLESVLSDFGISGQITDVAPGPVVTLYELEPAPGIRAARVIALADDIARNMSAASVRVAVVPGRNVIGIEMPNQRRETVLMRELLESEAYNSGQQSLPLILGKDIAGAPIIADLARMPHLLIAGTTGSGKSVSVNTMILSLLYRLPPQRCRFIMIDPKMLELSVYEGIPHLLTPVVTEPKKAIVAMKWVVREMEERYRAMSKLGVRNIDGYNIRLKQARDRGEELTRQVQTGFNPGTGKPIFEEQPLDLSDLPYIVVIVDEMADLMLVAGKEIEIAVQRLAQMARAAGIHIIMATQRPSVDVITGTIKANFPTRISFQVTSKIDSRTILGEQGAEQLLGQGDMLYMAGGGRITRVHGPFVRDSEVEKVVAFLKAQGEPDYLDEVTEGGEDGDFGDAGGGSDGDSSGGNEMYDMAVDLVQREGKASTSFLQRHLKLGYNRAAVLIERMEREGVVSAANHVGKREVFGGKRA
ncbi:MAG: DNA translocase FtsK 4TM domain-containing protein [Alphaproteobacteria bacterium]